MTSLRRVENISHLH